MKFQQVIDFLNSIQEHYQSSLELDHSDRFDDEDVIRLYIEQGSIEKIFETLVLRFEEDAIVDDAYLQQIFQDFNIDTKEANSLLKEKSIPKEPSFSKQALFKKPSFSKTTEKERTISSDHKVYQHSKSVETPNPTIIKDESDGSLNVISFLIPFVGIIYYAINQDNRPVKSASALRTSLFSVILYVVIYLITFS